MSPYPSSPQSKSFNSQNLKLHYLDWGNESAPLLVLLHGMWDHAQSWKWVAENFRDEWHVVAMDLRGHGDSQWSPDGAYLPAYHSVDFINFIEFLGVDTFDLIAHSYGGNPAARFSALYPERVRKLVLVDAMGPNKQVLKHWAEQGTMVRLREWTDKQRSMRQQQKYFGSIEEGCEKLQKVNTLLTDAQTLHLVESGVVSEELGYRWKYDPLVGNFTLEDYSTHLSEFWKAIRCPTLLCWGPKSWTTNPAEDGSKECFDNAQCLTFENSGHWIHHNQLDEFVSAAQSFLKG